MLHRTILVAAVTTVGLLSPSAKSKADEARSRPVVIVASASILPEGAKCRIEMAPEPSGEFAKTITFYEGTIAGSTKDKVLLTSASIEVHAVNHHPLSHVPFLGRLYKNTGIARSPLEEKEVPVPVNQIKSITLIEAVKLKGDGGKQRPPAPGKPRVTAHRRGSR